MAEYTYLQLRREGNTLVCTINNPPKNYLTQAILAELRTMVAEVETDDTLRALVITGGVEGIFITHYSVEELVRLAPILRAQEASGAAEPHAMHKLIAKLQGLPIPVIAAINGTAMGGGCELALGCDFRYMARGAQFGLPEVRIGLLPGAGGTQRYTRLLGAAKAMELLLLGDTLDAGEAARLGLIHRAVEPDELMPAVMALAEELGKRPPQAIALIKQCVYQGGDLAIREALAFEQDAFWQTMRSEDADRLMRAYLEGDQSLDEF